MRETLTLNLIAMNTRNLFPNRWKPIGWLLLILCIPPGIWYLVDEESFPWRVEVTIPWPYGEEKSEFQRIVDGINIRDQAITLDLADEILALGVLLGLMVVGFARLRVEDERTAKIRLESLQWAMYGNTLVLALCILFVHGTGFFTIMIYNMFTPLLIFAGRFHWMVYRESRELSSGEGREVLS